MRECLGRQRGRCVPMTATYATQSNLSATPALRSVFLFSQPVSVHDCSTSISRLTSPPLGPAYASLNRRPDRSPFPLLPHASSALLFSTFKIEATIRNAGDMIGWKSDNNTVGQAVSLAPHPVHHAYRQPRGLSLLPHPPTTAISASTICRLRWIRMVHPL